MSKKDTIDIQDKIYDIGNMLGFTAKKEETFIDGNKYSPRYDVVWYLNLSDFINNKENEIDSFFREHNIDVDYTQIPFAAFEIEGSTTSSKNQVGNLTSLYLGNFLYRFLITNNKAASKEKDTYRRGVKIVRTYNYKLGTRNVILFDKYHLEKIDIEAINKTKPQSMKIREKSKSKYHGTGGESSEMEKVYQTIFNVFENTNFTCCTDYSPDIFTKMYNNTDNLYSDLSEESKTDKINRYFGKEVLWVPEKSETKQIKKDRYFYYFPKIDISICFEIPPSFVYFLNQIERALGHDSIFYPEIQNVKPGSVYPIFSFEIESQSNKHSGGGLINASNFSYYGILVSPEKNRNLFDTYKERMRLNNAYFINLDKIMEK